MKILAIRITNFRSIIDSGWVPLSPDGITVLVGQNESGKTSMLDAMHFALSSDEPTDDDCRIGSDFPRVQLRTQLEYSEIESDVENLAFNYANAVATFLADEHGIVVLNVNWNRNSEGEFEADFSIESETLPSLLETAKTLSELGADAEDISAAQLASNQSAPSPVKVVSAEDEDETIDSAGLASIIWDCLPLRFFSMSKQVACQIKLILMKRETLREQARRQLKTFLILRALISLLLCKATNALLKTY